MLFERTFTSSFLLPLLLCGGLWVTLGCSSEASKSTTGTPGSGGSTGTGSATSTAGAGGGNPQTYPEEVVGTFSIELKSALEATDTTPALDAFTSIVGRVYEYPVPQAIGWVLVDEQAGCQLLKPKLPFCDPTCANGAICVESDSCVSFPTAFDLGDVTLSGIATKSGASMFSMSPLPPSNTYQALASVGVLFPPFDEGARVELSVPEGDLGAFTITTSGIHELSLTDPEAHVPFVPGKAVMLKWGSPQDPQASRVEVAIDISHHGGQKGEIRCDVPDTGSLELDAALVTGLIELGFSGFPTLRVTRIAAGSAPTRVGRVALRTVNSVERPIDIPGLVSCENVGMADGCPDGQVCQTDLRCE